MNRFIGKKFYATLFTAASLLAITSLAHAEGTGFTFCANKEDGIVRLLSRGVCRRSETSLLLNATGPRGPQGEQGLQGPAGADGVSGSELIVQDATGKEVGIFLGFIGPTLDTATVLIGNEIWSLGVNDSASTAVSGTSYFSDSSCTAPLWIKYQSALTIPALTNDQIWPTVKTGGNPVIIGAKPTGDGIQVDFYTSPIFGFSGYPVGVCTDRSAVVRTAFGNDIPPAFVYESVTKAAPTYTAPLTVVSK